MSCNRIVGACVAATLLAVMLPATSGAGETTAVKEQLVGSWSLVSLEAEVGGSMIEPFGSEPIGRMILGSDGTFATITLRPELPAFASNSRMQGTPEEYQAIVQGSTAFFGTYTVDEAESTIVFRIENSTFPNWNGNEQHRVFTVTGDELSYTNPATQLGGGSSKVVWKRVP